MTQYDNQYYIAHTLYTSDQMQPAPDDKTAARKYRYKKMSAGEAPLIFVNGFAERDQRTGDQRVVTDIMSDGSSLLVTTDLKDELARYDTQGMQFYPAIFKIEDGRWLEDYWYLNFYRTLDCLDRARSILEDDDDEDFPAEVDQYALDANVLDSIPEEQRMLFKMGGCSKSYVFVHQEIADYLKQCGATGVKLFPVSDFTEGDQYEF